MKRLNASKNAPKEGEIHFWKWPETFAGKSGEQSGNQADQSDFCLGGPATAPQVGFLMLVPRLPCQVRVLPAQSEGLLSVQRGFWYLRWFLACHCGGPVIWLQSLGELSPDLCSGLFVRIGAHGPHVVW